MFEILVNGIPRSYRDLESVAIEGGRILKGREKAEVVIVRETGQWAPVIDQTSSIGPWKDGPAPRR